MRVESLVTAEQEPEFEGFNDTLVLPSSNPTTPKRMKPSSKSSSGKVSSNSANSKPKSKSKSKSAHSTNDSSSIASPLSSHFQSLSEDGVRVAEKDDEELGDIADRIHGLDFSEHALEFGLGQKQQQRGEPVLNQGLENREALKDFRLCEGDGMGWSGEGDRMRWGEGGSLIRGGRLGIGEPRSDQALSLWGELK